MDLHAILRQMPLLNSLDDTALKGLAQNIRLQSLKTGQALFYKGDEGTALYIVKRGAIKIVLRSKLGSEIIVAILGKNDFFGAMAMIDEEPRSADAIAVEPTEVFVLRRADFLRVLQSDVNALRAILRELSHRLRKTDDILEDVCFLNVGARLAKKLVDLAETSGRPEGGGVTIDIVLTQQELGDMIGATRESINKELKLLREKGLASMDGGRIRINDLERLKRRIH